MIGVIVDKIILPSPEESEVVADKRKESLT